MKVVGETGPGPILPVWQSLKGFSQREPGLSSPGTPSLKGIPGPASPNLHAPSRPTSITPTGRLSPSDAYRDEIPTISSKTYRKIDPPNTLLSPIINTPTMALDNSSIPPKSPWDHKSSWDPLSSSTTSTSLSHNNMINNTLNRHKDSHEITIDGSTNDDSTNFADLPIAKDEEEIENANTFR